MKGLDKKKKALVPAIWLPAKVELKDKVLEGEPIDFVFDFKNEKIGIVWKKGQTALVFSWKDFASVVRLCRKLGKMK